MYRHLFTSSFLYIFFFSAYKLTSRFDLWISRFDFMVSYCELPISNFAITLRQVWAKYGQQAVYATIMAGRVKMGLGE